MEKSCIIDRFEGNWAVIEYGRGTFNFPRDLLPADTNEGDVIDFSVVINQDETTNRRKRIEDKFKKLLKK